MGARRALPCCWMTGRSASCGSPSWNRRRPAGPSWKPLEQRRRGASRRPPGRIGVRRWRRAKNAISSTGATFTATPRSARTAASTARSGTCIATRSTPLSSTSSPPPTTTTGRPARWATRRTAATTGGAPRSLADVFHIRDRFLPLFGYERTIRLAVRTPQHHHPAARNHRLQPHDPARPRERRLSAPAGGAATVGQAAGSGRPFRSRTRSPPAEARTSSTTTPRWSRCWRSTRVVA